MTDQDLPDDFPAFTESAVTRIGVIGDIFGQHEALAGALRHFEEMGVHVVVATGNIVDGPSGDVNACCALLAEKKVITVRGNHDRWILSDENRDKPGATPVSALSEASVEFLSLLPVTKYVLTAKQPLVLCHGLGDDDEVTVRPWDTGYDIDANDALQRLIDYEGEAVVVCGHSRYRMVRRFDALTIVNGGTLHPEHHPGFALIDLARRAVTFYAWHDDGLVMQSDVTHF